MPVDIQLSGMEVSLVNVMSREPILRQYPDIQLKTPSSYRDVPIPDYVFEAILEQRKIYERNRSRRKSKFQDDDYICCSSYGRPRSKDFHFKYYKQLLKENDLPDIRWHDLRSTFCTLLLKNDFDPKAVSRLMGHAKRLLRWMCMEIIERLSLTV